MTHRLPEMPPASSPDFGALGADASLRRLVGALLTHGLLAAVLNY
ncbi:hypothetical protein [Aeromicrobium sp. PE09-221]|nr:hypothetical protein [Aeromicrobium sp. PE09-221]